MARVASVPGVGTVRALSTRVLCGLLEWSGGQLDEYLANVDLRAVGAVVSWAGADPLPVWFDIAREFTERWVHQQQMREAVGRVDDHADRYLSVVLRTFVWALPAQFRAAAPVGTAVDVDVASIGTWHLTCLGPGAWTLDEGPALPALTARHGHSHKRVGNPQGRRELTSSATSIAPAFGPPPVC